MPRACRPALVALALLTVLVLPLGSDRAPEAQAGEEDLSALLEALVDLPSIEARRKRADALAKRRDVSLESWHEAMASFGRFRGVGAGVHRDFVEMPEEQDLRGLQAARTEVTFYAPLLYDPKKPAPLLLTLHAAGDDGRLDHRRWLAVADALGMVIISPTDPRGIGGFTMSSAERDAVWQALRWARRTFNVDESRIHATGISRGGHLLWDAALRVPDRFALIAPMIGGPLVSLQAGHNNVRYAENLTDVVIRDLQGSKDDPILVDNLRLTFERLAAFGAADAELLEFPELGHSFDMGKVDWAALFMKARRPAVPARVVRCMARPGEGRAHWVEILESRSPVAEVFALRAEPTRWAALSGNEQRREVVKQAEGRTARVKARLLEPGRIAVETQHVKKLRLLLTPDMLDPQGGVDIILNGRSRTQKTKPDKQVLLREFSERFDRSFLPVAEVVLRP